MRRGAAPDSACRSRDLVLTRRPGMSGPIPRALSELHPDLVLHGSQEDSRHEPNQVSDLHPDLVLREVPGDSVERSPHARRRRTPRHWTLRRVSRPRPTWIAGCLFSRRSSLRPFPQPPLVEVLRIAGEPPRLRLALPALAALRPCARDLPRAYALVGPEPTPAVTTRTSVSHARW